MRRSSLLLLGVSVILAAGCGGTGKHASDASSSTGTSSVATTTDTDTVIVDSTDMIDGTQEPPTPPPPPASDKHTIAWAEAKRLIARCEVREIFQAHSLYVELQLKDGRKLNTREPGIDDVLHLQERSGCAGVPIAVE